MIRGVVSMKKTEKETKLKEFYKKKRTQNKLEYEIDILANSNNEMKAIIENDFKSDVISERIERNNNIITDKHLKVNDIKAELAAMEFIISSLPEDEKTIIEMRYKNNKDYQSIVEELNISKSTISRRISNVFNILEEELDM